VPSDSLQQAVEGRVIAVVPGAANVSLHPSPVAQLDLSFSLGDSQHRFWFYRENSSWHFREHRINGHAQPKIIHDPVPRFEILIAAALSHELRRPRIEVVELRCPDDSRRLFGKLVLQTPRSSGGAPNLLEFSCPQCKRSTGMVTMHMFDSNTGELVKTQANEPWVKSEPQPWFSRPDQDTEEDEHGSFLPTKEAMEPAKSSF
jgi:hypothetical protein